MAVWMLAVMSISYSLLFCETREQTGNISFGIYIQGDLPEKTEHRLHDIVDRMNWKYSQSSSIVIIEDRNISSSQIHAIQKHVNQTVTGNSKKFNVLITYTDCDMDRLLTSFSTRPRIAVTQSVCDVTYKGLRVATLHLNPGLEMTFHALQDILDREPMSLADLIVLLYDSTVLPARVSMFAQWLARGRHVKSSAIYGLSGRSNSTHKTGRLMAQQIKFIGDKMKTEEINTYAYVVVMYSEEHVKTLLRKVIRYEMNNIRFMWLVVGDELRPRNFDLQHWDKNNLVFLTADLHTSLHVRDDCPLTQDIIKDARNESFDNKDFYLLEAVSVAFEATLVANYNCPNDTGVKDLGGVLRKEQFSGIIHGVKYGRNGYNRKTIYELYRTQRMKEQWGKIELINIGTWTKDAGLNVSEGSIFKNRFSDFEQRILNISMIEVHPFVIKETNYSAEDNVTYTGFCIDLLEEMKTRLNFSYRIVTPDPPVVGIEVSDNVWTGEMGLIIEKKADMIAGPITITMERAAVVDFTSVFMEGDSSIIMKKQEGDGSALNRIFEPFHYLVWVATILFFLLFTISLVIANWWLPPGENSVSNQIQNRDEDDNKRMSKTSHCFSGGFKSKKRVTRETLWLSYTHFMDQSSVEYPTSVAARSLLVTIWLFTILISAYYTANLAATLTAPSPTPHIESINELAEQTAIKPIIKDSTALTQLFNNSPSPSVYSQIWHSLQQSMPFPKDNDGALRMVKETGDYAFLGDTAQLKYVMSKDCNTYVMAKEGFFKGGLAFVVPKDELYRDTVSATISKMQEAGLIERLQMKWWPADTCTSLTEEHTSASLQIPALSGAFFVCAVFALAGVLAFIVEYLCWRPLEPKEESNPGKIKAEKYVKKDTVHVPTGADDIILSSRL